MSEIIQNSTSSLKPYQANARHHSDKQICKIAESIRQFGFNNPILIDSNNTIIAGHGRWKAAQRLGLEKVPTLLISHLSEDEMRAYILADNKLAELSSWDPDILAIELQHLSSLDLSFDIEITGFESGEIDFLIDGPVIETADPLDDAPEVNEDTAITNSGDLWCLGAHRLYCGSSLNEQSYHLLLGDEKAQMVFTDPPYNVPIHNHVCGKGSVKHDEFKMASGEMSSVEFVKFLETCMTYSKRFSASGAISYFCMDWRHMSEILQASQSVEYELKNLCVWVKNNGGMGSFYRSRHELIFVFKNGIEKHINNIDLGKNGRYRTNVWEYAGINTFGKDRDRELAMHPTVKPVLMVADAIKDCSKKQGVILDIFGGSGTTLIASEKTGRRARLIELDPKYCDVIVRRWESMTGDKAYRQEI